MLNYPVFRSEGNWALADLRREMDRLFDDFWTPAQNNARALGADWQPACDIEEGEDHYLLTLEAAGIPKDQIRIEVVGNEIVISGERNRQAKRKQDGQAYTERRFGKFQRSFALPSGVDSTRIEANYQDGILRVWVPKAESAKPRQVKIGNGTNAGFFGKLLGSQSQKKDEGDHARSAETAKAVRPADHVA